MGHPIGLPSEELADGTWVGTTPEDVQLAIGQMYQNAGILPGDQAVSRVKGTTGWSYAVPSLVAFIWTSRAARRAVLVPVEAETLPVSAPVGGAARTDTIYVGSDGVVKIAQGANAPGGAVVIDRMVIPAGATNTQGAVSNWDIVYAIPTGASLGRLAFWSSPGRTASNQTAVTVYTKRFFVPTDRLVRVDLNTTIRAAGGATGKSGRMAFGVRIDGGWARSLSAVYDHRYDTRSASWSTGVSGGSHTIEVWTQGCGGDPWEFTAGQASTEFSRWDMGVDD